MKRCIICNKKIPLIDSLIICRCKEDLCKDHVTNHNCTFDYKKIEREALKKQLISMGDKRIEKV